MEEGKIDTVEKNGYGNDLKEIITCGREKNRKGDGEYSIPTIIKGIIDYNDFKQVQLGEKTVDRIVLDRKNYIFIILS